MNGPSSLHDRLDTQQQVELGEGLEISLRMAGPLPRMLAWLIDLSIKIGVYLLLAIVLGFTARFLDAGVVQGLFLLSFFLLWWFYAVWFESGKKGATPGKRAMKLRVTRLSGAPISWSESLIRNFLRFVDFLPFCYGFGLVSSLLTKRFQRLGDLAAGTVVVYEESLPAATLAKQHAVPPQRPKLALTAEEQLALTEYLERAPKWSDERKIELANHARGLTGATGPEGVRQVLSTATWIREGAS
ncbi:MAG: RDD family protein [Verrucomicrobiota bacterium]